jgi:hypothetical protein
MTTQNTCRMPTQQELVMVTFDQSFAGRTAQRDDFYCLIRLPSRFKYDVGGIIEELVVFAELFDPVKDQAQVFWLE